MRSRAIAASLSLVLGAVVACASTSSPGSVPLADGGPAVDGGGEEDGSPGADGEAPDAPVTLLSSFDLPRTDATQGLSAAAFDGATGALFTLQDVRPSIVPLQPSSDFKTWTVGTPIVVTGAPDATWDGEGIVRTEGGFYAVTNETTPTVVKLDATGKVTATLTLPAHFANQSTGNKGLESLSLSPSGRFLFTANEGALVGDDTLSTKSKGTTVRILRRELTTSTDHEIAYRTEPLGAGTGAGDMGISDLAALSDDELLVLERGFQVGYGNTLRIFRITFAGPDVLAVASVGPSAAVVAKTLLVDLGSLPSAGITHPGPQPNPILDNFEALAVGPRLADGRRLLFVVSDDNASADQVARVLVLAVRGL